MRFGIEVPFCDAAEGQIPTSPSVSGLAVPLGCNSRAQTVACAGFCPPTCIVSHVGSREGTESPYFAQSGARRDDASAWTANLIRPEVLLETCADDFGKMTFSGGGVSRWECSGSKEMGS
jgi:hypothetical protein